MFKTEKIRLISLSFIDPPFATFATLLELRNGAWVPSVGWDREEEEK